MQQILVYIILAFAIGYLAKKLLLPSYFFSGSKKQLKKGCGGSDCGCN